MNKIIVFGASGQLGQCLRVVSEEQHIGNVTFLAEARANILDTETLKAVFSSEQPKYCINCAAYTAVDNAEDEEELARKINRDGAENLARLCDEFNCTLIHISTDFVFAGDIPSVLTEANDANPINVYGLTKLEGEDAVKEYCRHHFILRTSWLYSEFGNNFVKTMLRLGKEKEELKIIADQIGTPTYAIDLANAIFQIILHPKQEYGLYHYSNEGASSWYDFAKAIFDIGNLDVNAIPVKSSEYVTRATRPAFSVMDKTKIKTTFGLKIPYWRDSLIRCIEKLQEATN